jgi:transposase-like protein
MSKIPQGEWDAIAARYAQGESITRIAQSYGCTPPAIHYILKRSRQRPAANFEQPVKPAPHPAPQLVRQPGPSLAAPDLALPAAPHLESHNGERPAVMHLGSSPRPNVEPAPDRDREFAPIRPTQSERRDPVASSQPATPAISRAGGGGSAFTAGLDDELHGRAEAAIAAFRSSFDAALVEGSPLVRQRLREAASDLMRVAARTTIVLDRLNASAEHSSGRAEHPFRR